MGKGYKGGPCIYCLEREAEDGDHVISRQFFPKDERDNLPKVPACKACNNAKSKLEHRLTAVLPFGGTHADASKTLAMVEPRLAKNRPLHVQLAEGMAYLWRSINGGPWKPEMTIPIEGEDVQALCALIVKGLAFHHWKLTFGPEHLVRAAFFTEAGRQLFDPLFDHEALDKVKDDFGDGAFTYEGVQAKECAEFTLWKMSIYGLEVSGDKRAPMERSSMIYGFTAPKSRPVAEALRAILNQ